MPTAFTLIRASCGPISGFGTSISSNPVPGFVLTMALIGLPLGFLTGKMFTILNKWYHMIK